jgi:hypothetical protein
MVMFGCSAVLLVAYLILYWWMTSFFDPGGYGTYNPAEYGDCRRRWQPEWVEHFPPKLSQKSDVISFSYSEPGAGSNTALMWLTLKESPTELEHLETELNAATQLPRTEVLDGVETCFIYSALPPSFDIHRVLHETRVVSRGGKNETYDKRAGIAVDKQSNTVLYWIQFGPTSCGVSFPLLGDPRQTK